MNRNEIIEYCRSVPGFLYGDQREELGALYDLATQANGNIVEIGSYLGKSTIAIASGNNSGTKQRFTTIDPSLGELSKGKNPNKDIYQELLSNLEKAKVLESIDVVKGYSLPEADKYNEKIGFLFIDGLHDYESVKQDFHAWRAKVKLGGRIAFHDYDPNHPGVMKFIDEEVILQKHYKKIKQAISLAVFERVS